MSLDQESLVRRLGFIRHAANAAVIQSHQPGVRGLLSVLAVHDAVEMFMVLALEEHDCPASERIDFLQYWDRLKDRAGIEVTQRGPMKRLNDVRVNLKHRGLLPRTDEIEAARVNATNFFLENT